MIYIIENDQLKIKISSMGAELQSVRRLEDDTEYLWQGDPTYWKNRATNLFPICGRLFEGKYTYRGKEYEMIRHGFAKLYEWDVLRQETTALTLQLRENEETLKMYPFRFSLEMTYTLAGEELSITTIVRNLDDKTMYFAIGGHPGFNVPLEANKSFEDYYIEFDDPCRAKKLCFSEACFYLEKDEMFPLEEDCILHLNHDMFDHDAIFLRDMASGATLRCADGKRSVRLSYPEMSLLGLWHKPLSDAPYICIEPLTSYPSVDGKVDDLETKQSMHALEPQGVYRNVYTITFE